MIKITISSASVTVGSITTPTFYLWRFDYDEYGFQSGFSGSIAQAGEDAESQVHKLKQYHYTYANREDQSRVPEPPIAAADYSVFDEYIEKGF